MQQTESQNTPQQKVGIDEDALVLETFQHKIVTHQNGLFVVTRNPLQKDS